MRIVDVKSTRVFVPYRAPFAPYVGSLGPAAATMGARSLVVQVVTDDGLSGWGECSGEARPDLTAIVGGQDPFNLERILELLRSHEVSSHCRSAVEMALWDLMGKATGRPLCDLLGGQYRSRVELCACQGITAPKQAGAIAAEVVRGWGFHTLKSKAGIDLAQDAAIIQAMRAAVGPDVALRPDPNTAYSVEAARQLLPFYREAAVQYAEDVCPSTDLGVWAGLRREYGVPLAVNMALGPLADALRLANARDAVDYWLPDPTVAGGVLEVKKIAHLAGAVGVACGMHCSHDLGIKTAANVHIAASSPSFALACDSLYHALQDDLLVQPLAIVDGAIPTPTGPGLGIEVDPEKVERYRDEQPPVTPR